MPINEFENPEENQEEALSSLNADLVRLQEQVETLSKSNELIVIRYANSEKEVFKLRAELEKCQKQIKTLMKDNETVSQKNKQLTSDRTHFTQLAESKSSTLEEENKRLRLKVAELQNELKGLEITKSQFSKDHVKEKLSLQQSLDESLKRVAELREQLEQSQNDITELKRGQQQTKTEDTENIQKQYDKLKQDLASKEFLISWTQDRVLALECECEQVRHSNVELLNDMSACRSKEAELVAYTQAVTEKNVSLQSKLSSMEAKIAALEEENVRFATQIKESDGDIKGVEKNFLIEKKELNTEKQSLLDEICSYQQQITTLQQQLDEARGEMMLLRKKQESTIKELNKELRRQIKDNNCSAVEVLSQSSMNSMTHSRTSSCSSLNTVEVPKKSPEINNFDKQDIDYAPLPDQQILIERIVKLQKMLAKQQDKIDFLEDNASQLIDALQKKSKIIQSYALSQDHGAMSTEVADKNKAEMIKHGGIMASLYTSKPSEEISLELTLEINSKLQAVLEDSLLKNITLKEGINTLGVEVSKLTEVNKELSEKLKSLNV